MFEDGSVVTWGNPSYGGDSSRVQHRLKHVRHVEAAGNAFAAILADGSVVTLGDPLWGGNSFTVQRQLKLVTKIAATASAFAAVFG